MVQNILDYLEATAADCPDKPAFEDLEHSYTFAQVLGNAKRIGSALLQVLPQNAPVPVLMEKEAWTLNVFMGAVCAGCFYTLVEPEQPDERIRTILDTLEAEVIVTSGKLSERVAALGFTGKVLLAEELAESGAGGGPDGSSGGDLHPAGRHRPASQVNNGTHGYFAPVGAFLKTVKQNQPCQMRHGWFYNLWKAKMLYRNKRGLC